MTKFIFITGGVISGIGKGVTSASVGNILKSQGYKVFVLKLDPYLNADPGALSPREHGELFITSDGWKSDLDLGHYERFMDVELSKDSNYTSGRIYKKIFDKEKRGFYKGRTIQVVPHVIDEIIGIIRNTAKKEEADFMIIEIGGTVGDMESRPYIHAISKFGSLYPKQTFFIHVSFVPYLNTSKEYKSKPSQESISLLRSFGINPDALLLRSQGEINYSIIEKVATTSFLENESVINVPDKANIYEIPIFLKDQNLIKLIYKHFRIRNKINESALKPWESFLEKYLAPKTSKAKLLLTGEDIEYPEAYLSVITSLRISAAHLSIELDLDYVKSSKIENSNLDEFFKKKKYDGIILLPNNKILDFESEVNIAYHARENNIPILGIKEGYYAMVIAAARSKKIFNATTINFKNQFEKGIYITKKLSKVKLGNQDIILSDKSLISKIYKANKIAERYNSGYEVDKKFIDEIEDENFVFTGYSTDTKNPQICEYKKNDFYLGVQYHPEFSTTVLKSHKLFDAFLKSTIK